jgi:hypothetical protein
MSEPNDPVSPRSTFLPLLMASLAAGFFCVVMILITGGFFFYVLAAGVGLVLLGMFHYVTWGRSMDEEVAAERRRQDLLDRASEAAAERDRPWTYRR